MYITTSKKLTSLLNKAAKTAGAAMRFDHVKMNENEFKWYVDIDTSFHGLDYDYKTETFSVIRVSYPTSYYACDNYLTTRKLTKIFKRSAGTLESFLNDVLEDMTI